MENTYFLKGGNNTRVKLKKKTTEKWLKKTEMKKIMKNTGKK